MPISLRSDSRETSSPEERCKHVESARTTEESHPELSISILLTCQTLPQQLFANLKICCVWANEIVLDYLALESLEEVDVSGWGCSTVVEFLLSMHKVLGSILSTGGWAG